MRQEENEILTFENRLQRDRQELNDLISRSRTSGMDALMQDKLAHLQQEVEYMGNQLHLLQNALQDNSTQSQPIQAEIPVNVAPQPVQQQTTVNVMPQSVQQQPTVNVTLQPVQQQVSVNTGTKKDLEKTFGKAWMGVIASGLIFVSLIIFAILLLPNLTQGIKMAAMFVVSFAFTAVGLVKLKKDGKNAFYLSLSGCGIGAVYISILVSNIYFKAINDIVLYVLIFAWAACVCLMRRFGSILFELIGQFGILLAVAFGCSVCVDGKDAGMLLMLTLFFVATTLVFLLVHRKKLLKDNLVSLCFQIADMLFLMDAFDKMSGSSMIWMAAVILLIYIAFSIVFCYLSELSQDGAVFGIMNVAYVYLTIGVLSIILNDAIEGETIVNVVALVICTVVLVEAELRLDKDAKPGRAIIQVTMMIFMMVSVCGISFLENHVFLAVLMIPFLCAGFCFNNGIYKYGSLIFMFLFQLGSDIPDLEKLVWGYLYFGLLIWYTIRKKEQYQSVFKLLAYVLFFIKLTGDCIYVTGIFDATASVAFTVWSIVTGGLNLILMRLDGMKRNPVTGAEETQSNIVFRVIHAIQMFVILLVIGLTSYMAVRCISILWSLVLFCANAKTLLQKHPGVFAGIYTGVKFTLLLVVILGSFDAPSVVISVGCFVLAIVSIVAGFGIQVKSLRIYGLVLSMVSVFKLLLIDIAYGGLLQLAAGFFVSGLLCFAISMIYNMIDKKFKEVQS